MKILIQLHYPRKASSQSDTERGGKTQKWEHYRLLTSLLADLAALFTQKISRSEDKKLGQHCDLKPP